MKLGFYFGMALALFSILIIVSDQSRSVQAFWLIIAPIIACLVFLPDICDYLAFGFFSHHPWTHHPVTLVYFLPLATIALAIGLDILIVQFAAIAWGLHMLLDLGNTGLPIGWEPVRQSLQFRSYTYPAANHRWIIRLPQPFFEIVLVQRLGFVIGVGLYILIFSSVVITWI
ncbi:MAG: hypothetical protein ACFFC7_14595 [Candidatus Hermodarchaeota archaeon]